MNAFEYILSKQILWAHNNKIALIGSEGSRGRPVYTNSLEENLFEPLEADSRKAFEQGDGQELKKKMRALHSSSALGVNIFQYWLKIKQVPRIAAACGLCDRENKGASNIKFEQKYPISGKFRYSPNIDVVIENSPKSKFKAFGIECKFSEAYSSHGHSGLKKKYLALKDVWGGLPKLNRFAKSISPNDSDFIYLHPAQLIKHILGLKRAYGKNGFRLLYLWYDALGQEGARHRNEIEKFKHITKKDGVFFHALSYQELIAKLSREYRTGHEKYINYISGRYL